jgi:hypothetical protein
MITKCKYCGIDVEVDVDGFENGDVLQTTCPECGRDFEFTVVADSSQPSCYFYIDENNEQAGPLSIEDLQKVITSKTLVWKKGQADWLKAEDIPELKSIVKVEAPPPIPQPVQIVDVPKPVETGAEEVSYQPMKPDTNLTMAILCTLFCCVPFGVVAIYYASKVNTSYHQGAYFDAEDYSEKAESYTYWGVGLGIVLDMLYFIFN